MTKKRDNEKQGPLNALRHPLRQSILKTLNGQRDPGSPRELADELDRPLSSVSYHVRVLADFSALQLVRTQQVRGSVQHFYEPSPKFMADPVVAAVLGLSA